jgi:hypothetical protein
MEPRREAGLSALADSAGNSLLANSISLRLIVPVHADDDTKGIPTAYGGAD